MFGKDFQTWSEFKKQLSDHKFNHKLDPNILRNSGHIDWIGKAQFRIYVKEGLLCDSRSED